MRRRRLISGRRQGFHRRLRRRCVLREESGAWCPPWRNSPAPPDEISSGPDRPRTTRGCRTRLVPRPSRSCSRAAEIAHQVATALRNDTSPIPGVLSERLALKGIDLVAECAGHCHGWAPGCWARERLADSESQRSAQAADHGNRGAAADQGWGRVGGTHEDQCASRLA